MSLSGFFGKDVPIHVGAPDREFGARRVLVVEAMRFTGLVILIGRSAESVARYSPKQSYGGCVPRAAVKNHRNAHS